MKNPNPLISFVVVSYNDFHRLRMCLEAISHQVYPQYEIIVSDDGSDTHSLEAFSAIHAPLQLFTFITRAHDIVDDVPVRNIPAVANQAIPYVKGDIIQFLQQDHIIQPDFGLWLARCFSDEMVMFGLLDRREDVSRNDLDAMLRNLHIPEAQTRYEFLLNQGRRILVEFDDWRLTDGFDFAIARSKWRDMDTRFVGPSHAILDAMLTYRLNGLHFVLNPLMRLWHWEHPSQDPANLEEFLATSYKQMQEKWGEDVWNSTVVPKLYDFRVERRKLQEGT